MSACIFSQNLCDKGKQGLEGLPGPWHAAVVVEEPATWNRQHPTFCPGWVLTTGSDLTKFLLCACPVSFQHQYKLTI